MQLAQQRRADSALFRSFRVETVASLGSLYSLELPRAVVMRQRTTVFAQRKLDFALIRSRFSRNSYDAFLDWKLNNARLLSYRRYHSDLDLFAAAKRYHKLLELGREMGITPQVELWGFSKSLSRLGELMFVAVESGHPDACLLPDVYHIYKGGSDFHGLKLINGRRIHVFHVNDYPAQPPRETIGDADRVYPGDGVAPLNQIFGDMFAAGFRGMLSLELFNRDYWKQDALKVARTGLEKTRQAVRRAFADQ